MTLEALGDRWSLIVLRDLMFGPHRHFREVLNHSMEGIASNILADRLSRLTSMGLLHRRQDPSHKQKVIYCLTEPAIQLVPVMVQLGAWGSAWLPTSLDLRVRADLLADGGPTVWEQFMDELRAEHVEGSSRPSDGVLRQLDDAYEGQASRDD